MAKLLQFPEPPRDAALAAAQEMMWDAWEEPVKAKRLKLAKQALATSDLCADAWLMLARESARTAEERIEMYSKAMSAGERAIGTHGFRDYKGMFWGFLETRPYMRARHCLAMELWSAGKRDEAVEHYQAMLALNPNDNQGIRYLLIDCLLTLGNEKQTQALLKKFAQDGAASWTYARALLSFRQHGDCAASRKALANAMASNRYVPSYLLRWRKMPRQLPDLVGIGDETEAISCALLGIESWAAASGALDWLTTVELQRAPAARPRAAAKAKKDKTG